MVDPRGRERGRDRGTGRQGLLNEAREEGCERRLPTQGLNVCLLLMPFTKFLNVSTKTAILFLFNDALSDLKIVQTHSSRT